MEGWVKDRVGPSGQGDAETWRGRAHVCLRVAGWLPSCPGRAARPLLPPPHLKTVGR